MSRARANADATSQTYIENATAAQELSGTYSTERLYFNDSYQLTGDVTVTGHLALGTIADEDVVITQDSTERTITGSGTLESGELLSSKQTDLTEMTGVLGSVVTGSPNLNLGNATFPAGHISKVFYNTDVSGTEYTVAGPPGVISCDPFEITCVIGRKYIINGSCTLASSNESGTARYHRILSTELYYGVTDRTKGDVAGPSPDIKLSKATLGRVMNSASTTTAGAGSWDSWGYTGYFIATSTTHYVYTSLADEQDYGLKMYAYNSSTYPHICIVYEVMP